MKEREEEGGRPDSGLLLEVEMLFHTAYRDTMIDRARRGDQFRQQERYLDKRPHQVRRRALFDRTGAGSNAGVGRRC